MATAIPKAIAAPCSIAHPSSGDALDAVDDQQHCNERLQCAQDVHAAGSGIAELGQQDGAKREQQKHDGHVDEEHRAPPELGQDEAADQRADGGAGREARNPDPIANVRSRSSRNMLRMRESVEGASAAAANPCTARAAIKRRGAGSERRRAAR